MKKIIVLFLSALLLLTVSACGSNDTAAVTPTPAVTAQPTPDAEPTPVPEWKDLTTEYEVWVEDYMTTYNAAQANPTDNNLYDKLEKLAGEARMWDKKLSAQELALVDNPDLQNYIDEVLRITEKLNEFINSQST